MDKTPDYKLEEFLKLAAKAQSCRVCEAMCDKTAVLSELNGSIDPKVFFIAEAPGRQGADRTRKPFSGDKSGANFQTPIDSIDFAARGNFYHRHGALQSAPGAEREP